jgi:hypothetical protein
MADLPSGPSLDATPPLCELKKMFTMKLHYERPHEGDEKFIQNFGPKAKGKILGRRRRKLEDNIIKMCRKERG